MAIEPTVAEIPITIPSKRHNNLLKSLLITASPTLHVSFPPVHARLSRTHISRLLLDYIFIVTDLSTPRGKILRNRRIFKNFFGIIYFRFTFARTLLCAAAFSHKGRIGRISGGFRETRSKRLHFCGISDIIEFIATDYSDRRFAAKRTQTGRI